MAASSKAKAAKATVPSADGAPTFKHGTLSKDFETRLYAKGFKCVVGVDEAGRGPLAGPVVAAACYVPLDVVIEGIHDSKKLDEKQRKWLFAQITSNPAIKYAVHINPPARIDDINILQATLESMRKCVEDLPMPVDYALIDGNRMPTLDVDGETVVKGDGRVYSIAAASVIAKVTRDRLMVAYDKEYPEYGLGQHKGYGTKAHMLAIHKHGATPIHRMTFAPLNQL
ncbi:ribonuclease HII [Saprolegnia diclina VS20]|uniref:Ribonuclease n=1 Tax=Saprolegnia diclina (strain VS20) TaxID=1156394 RepID=T0Q458_SAPDV|nr:ribonuclease HII [Saprolegnia diclina VS20]EQC29376.1 ribonuclease HII [Saprolegnia diclina VS20]|eukprot:XP_008617143.1 ribonuclease HII [Saprolegnia diclina VS20]